MITREEAKYTLHIEMLKQSFHRQGDGMTSILLGNATSTAYEFFEKYIEQYEQHIKSLEAQLANTEQPTCDLELKAIKLIKILYELIDVYPNEVYDLCVKHNYFIPKDTQ